MSSTPNRPPFVLALCVALGALVPIGSVQAQTDPLGAPAVQQSTGGITYLSGGAGSEERAAMDARRAEFPLKVVLSAGSGEYVVAERVSLLSREGPLLVVRDAGPILMVQARPGQYTVEAAYQGRVEKRTVTLGKGAVSVGFRFPG
jgi:hypothetical protein